MADSARQSSNGKKRREEKVHRMDGSIEEHFKMSLNGKKSTAHEKKPASDGEPRRGSALEKWTSAKNDDNGTIDKQSSPSDNQACWTQEKEHPPLYNLSGGSGRADVLGAPRREPPICAECGSYQHHEAYCPKPPDDMEWTELKRM